MFVVKPLGLKFFVGVLLSYRRWIYLSIVLDSSSFGAIYSY